MFTISRQPASQLLLVLLLSLTLAHPAAAQDKVGIYWDTSYTQNVGTTATTPGTTTGYLVLQNASNPTGVWGWEACFDIDGPGVFAGWTFPGSAVNAGTEPCFATGYTTPLPYSTDILLGSFTFVATGAGPITISMEPDYFASLPGEMSYIPGNDPNGLIPMTTATGRREVAGLNGANPLVSVSHDLLDLGSVMVGESTTGILTVTNDSDVPFALDTALESPCLSFSVLTGGGPTTVAPHTSLNIAIGFAPLVDRQVFCELDLGPNLNPVQITGTGALLETSWTITGGPNLGSVVVGQERTVDIRFLNTGETPISISISLPDTCGDFSMTFNATTWTINPNSTLRIPVVFAPTSLGFQQCILQFGNDPVPGYFIWGTGVEATPSWDAPLSYDFGNISTGQSVNAAVTVTNTGTLTIDVDASLMSACDEFSIIQGGNPVSIFPGFSHSILLQFQSPLPGNFACTLDMGPLVWDIPLTAVAAPGPGTVLALPSPISFPTTIQGQSHELDVSLTNVAGHDVELDLSALPTGGAFSIVNGPGPLTLGPDSQAVVRVRFAPQAVGQFDGSLDLGTFYGGVPMTGAAGDSTPLCLIEPANFLAFGSVALDSITTRAFTITNVGLVPLTITPVSDSPHFLISAPAELLNPGQTSNLTVFFQPLTSGSLNGTINLGLPSCGGLSVSGFGIISSAWIAVTPDALIFPPVAIGDSLTSEVLLTNVGPYDLQLDPEILLPRAGFSVTQGGGLSTLVPSASHSVSVTFAPTFVDTFVSRLSFGSGIPPVSLHGLYLASDCEISADDVNFGALSVGSTDTRQVMITNNSAAVIEITPSSSSPAYEVDPTPFNLGIGATAPLQILFRPIQVLPYTGTVSLGDGPCADINCFGAGTPGGTIFQDVLGIFWDTGYFQTTTYVTQANTIVPGFLVLSNPSTGGGILGWECRVEASGPGIGLGWSLQGNAINLGSGNNFVVGLDTPLPYTDQTLLAEFQVLVPNLSAPTLFHVSPLFSGSVPDQMSWIPGSNPEALLPMNPHLIDPEVVARIEPSVPTGVDLPKAVTRLLPNVPNPFNPMTEIQFELGSTQQVSLRIYDVTGRLVRELANDTLETGPHTRVWQGRNNNGRQVSSGAYYVRLVTREKTENRKIMLVK